MVFTGRRFDAEEAYRLGLVTRLAGTAALNDVTAPLVEELGAGSSHAQGRAKRVLDTAAHPALLQTRGDSCSLAEGGCVLGRQALEVAVQDVWNELGAEFGECSMAAQLVCLQSYTDDAEVGRRARQCWYALSSACHAHPHELAPTMAELRGLLDEVEAFMEPGQASVPLPVLRGRRRSREF